MAYLSKDYYLNTFHGEPISDGEFVRLAETASDVIDAIISYPIESESIDTDKLQKAAAYQLEYIKEQGGISAVTGSAESQKVVTEKLDDYSVSEERTSEANQYQMSIGGIPVSPLTVAILRKMGLMSRWLYAGRFARDGN